MYVKPLDIMAIFTVFFFFSFMLCLKIYVDLSSNSLIFSSVFYDQHLNPNITFFISGFIFLVLEFLPGSLLEFSCLSHHSHILLSFGIFKTYFNCYCLSLDVEIIRQSVSLLLLNVYFSLHSCFVVL